MRAFLRADPDVIMVGEMRDQETCEIGIEASLTGHLVFSTLHTNSAPETITRLLDMGMDPFNFADALLGIMAQRFGAYPVQGLQGEIHSRQGRNSTTWFWNMVARKSSPKRVSSIPRILTLHKPAGCGKCGDTGYRGRMGIHEMLEGTDEVKRMVQLKKPLSEIRAQATGDGMTSLKQDGILKVFAGKTDIRQIRMVCIK